MKASAANAYFRGKLGYKAGRVLADCTLKAEEQTQLFHRVERGQHSSNGFTGGIQSLYKKVQNLLTQEVPPCPKQSQTGHQSENRVMWNTEEHASQSL